MYLQRLALIALAGLVSAVPLGAQGIPRGARTQTVTAAPRLMVANPFANAPADSANAVRIGSAAREQMKEVVGRNFTVVEQAQMNDALKQYGYPVDAILSPPLATTLAKNIQARVIMSGTLKGEHKSKATDKVTKREIGAGVILGERALILDTRATESVRVEVRARVLQIRKAMFRRLLQEYPEIAIALRARLSRNVLRVSAELSQVARRLSAIPG